MKICPRCKFENIDTAWDCLACNINIQWAVLNPSKVREIDLDPYQYKTAVAERSQLEERKTHSQQSLSSRNSSNTSGSNSIGRKKILFQNGSSITLSQKEEIKITRKTISFGRDVYQFHNVVGFSDGEVDLGKIIPMPIILTGFLMGFIVASLPFIREYGILILVLSSVGLAVNLCQEKKHGLLLTLTSGDKHLFITVDSRGLAKVVDQIRSFMESDDNSSYTVAVNNNSITVHGNFTGVAASGNNASTISSSV
jgi:hypothetical protein